MIIAKTPFRVSLVGGSTDLQKFIDIYLYGSVISFPITAHTYISIHKSHNLKYKVVYSQTEEVRSYDEIKNDIAREVLKHFNMEPVIVVFNASIPAVRGGLAASSSYMMSMIKAASIYQGISLSQNEIAKIGLKLERNFNTMTGFQDPYGCAIPSLKRLHFHHPEIVKLEFPDSNLLDNTLQMHLIDTGLRRQSTKVLNDINAAKARPLLENVEKLFYALADNDVDKFNEIIRNAWELKKQTSSLIMRNQTLLELEKRLNREKSVRSFKLLGAGGGGYFLTFSEGQLYNLQDLNPIKVEIDHIGVTGQEI